MTNMTCICLRFVKKIHFKTACLQISKKVLVNFSSVFGLRNILTLFYMGGGSKRPPLTDYCTLFLGGYPKWADFS